MVQIVLIRPGSTDYDDQGRIQGTLDIPLNQQGSAEVDRVIEQLRAQGLTALYSSPCKSATDTAAAIAAGLGIKAKTLDKMQNLDHGLWQGMLVDEVKRKQPTVFRQWQEQPEIICPPQGEMLNEALERLQLALAKLLKKHKDGKIGLVLPEPLASLAHSYLSGTVLGDLWKATAGCGSWEVLRVEPQLLAHSVQ